MVSGSPSSGRSAGGTHLAQLIRSTVPPMHPGGKPIVFGALAGTLGLRFLLRRVGLPKAGALVGRAGLVGTAASARVLPGTTPGHARPTPLWWWRRPMGWSR